MPKPAKGKGLLDVFIFPIGNTFTNQIQGRASLDAEFHLSGGRVEKTHGGAPKKNTARHGSQKCYQIIPNQYQIYSF